MFWYVCCVRSLATNKQSCTKSFTSPQLLWVTGDYPAVDHELIVEIYISGPRGYLVNIELCRVKHNIRAVVWMIIPIIMKDTSITNEILTK